MSLHKPTYEAVLHIAQRMRAIDKEEIYPLLFDPTPKELARRVMSDQTYCWLAATEEHGPVCAFGMFEVRPKAWTAFAFATDNFNSVALEVTRFLKKKVCPHLFLDLGAVRIEAHSHLKHETAHRWLTFLGAKSKLDLEYGPQGQAYRHFIMRRSDFDVTYGQKRSRLLVTGGKPDLARPDHEHSADVHPQHPQGQ